MFKQLSFTHLRKAKNKMFIFYRRQTIFSSDNSIKAVHVFTFFNAEL